MSKSVSFGPWRGANNVLDEAASAYTPPVKPGDPPPFLRSAINVDFDDEGYIRRRSGRRKLVDLVNGHSIASVGPWLLAGDGDTLQWIDTSQNPPVARPLAGGLSGAPISWVYAGRSAFGCNGTDTILIDPGPSAGPWAVSPPSPPNLSRIDGNLPAGKYLVAASVVTPDGREHGARGPAAIDLPDGGGIRVDLVGVSPSATTVNVYLTDANGDLPYHHTPAPAHLTHVDLVIPAPTTDPIQVLGLSGPPPGVDLVSTFAGRILASDGHALYWSQPFAHHLFDLANDVQLMPAPPVVIAPLSNGFYLADEHTVLWVEGLDPKSWRPHPVLEARSSRGTALVLPAKAIAKVDSPGPVAVWMTNRGLVAGTEDGQVQLLSRDFVAIDAYQRASLVYREQSGVRQLLAALDQPTQGNAFRAVDRADCVVTKAPRPREEHTECVGDGVGINAEQDCEATLTANPGSAVGVSDQADCVIT